MNTRPFAALILALGLAVCPALTAPALFAEEGPVIVSPMGGAHANHLEPSLCCCPPMPPDQPQRREFLPLRHTDITGTITGMIAEVSVKQEFFNPLKDRLEAVYVFPLPDNAAVHGLKITIKDRTIVGEVKTSEAARQTYAEAREAGQTAALVEQNRPNIFTASVANIPAGETVSIELTYFQTLSYDDGRYSFAFPMVVAPRYLAAGDTVLPPVVNAALPDGASAEERAQWEAKLAAQRAAAAPAAQPASYLRPSDKRIGNISLHLNIDAGVGLASVKCPTHEITVKQTGNTTATVDLAHKDEIPNKDFVLEYKVTNTALQAAIIAHKPKGSDVGYFLLMLVPKEEYESEEILPKEMIYIIDHSGSMRGEKMDQAKLALKSSLHQLNKDDTFTIVPFSGGMEFFSDKAVAFDQAHLDQADAFVAGIQATGGTEILRPMEWALNQAADAQRLRIVCFLTDGEVSNDNQVVQSVQAKAGPSRVYTFGIGNSVNRWMLRKMAEYGHGGFETILPGENMEEKIARFNDRTSYPVLRDVSANYGGLEVKDTYPATLPDLFTSQPIILLGTYTKGGAYTITVSGKTVNGLYSNDLKVNLPDESDANAGLPVIWARARVEDLNDRLIKAADRKPLVDEITALGLKFSLATDYTSFVVVEKKQVEKEGKLVTEEVRVPMPAGWAEESDMDEKMAADGTRRVDRLQKGMAPTGGAARFGGGNATGMPPPAPTAPSAQQAAGPGALPAKPAAPGVDAGPQANNQLVMTNKAADAANAPAPGNPTAAASQPMPPQERMKALEGAAAETNQLASRVNELRTRHEARDKQLAAKDGTKAEGEVDKRPDAPGDATTTGATGEFLGDREISDDQSEMLADVLRALAREQDVDGLWKDAVHDKGEFTALERSSIAILCYHRAGHTTKRGKFKAQMERAVDGLIKAEHEDGGYLLDIDGGIRLQAETALTLVEIAGARNKESYRAAALKALDALLKHQRADGLFPATAKGEGDKMVTAFALEALRRATTLNLGTYTAQADTAEKALGAKSADILKELARSAVKANTEGVSSLDRITGMAFYLTFGE